VLDTPTIPSIIYIWYEEWSLRPFLGTRKSRSGDVDARAKGSRSDVETVRESKMKGGIDDNGEESQGREEEGRQETLS